jgi:hypothetical protein
VVVEAGCGTVEVEVCRRAVDQVSSRVAQVALPAMGAILVTALIDQIMCLEMVFFMLDMGAPIMPGVAIGTSRATTEDTTAILEVIPSTVVRLMRMFGGMKCLVMVRILLV